MKIEGLNSTTALSGGAKPKAARSAPAEAPASPQESVQIGSAGVASAEAPLDTARVEAIRQAISEGRFQINPDAIAERLIQSARELVAAQREA